MKTKLITIAKVFFAWFDTSEILFCFGAGCLFFGVRGYDPRLSLIVLGAVCLSIVYIELTAKGGKNGIHK